MAGSPLGRLVAALLVACTTSGCADGGTAARSATSVAGQRIAPNAVVERVVDGDTIVVRVGSQRERVRMIGFNTPESVDPKRPVECFGHEASERMQQLLPADTPVHLERDAEARDTYGRLLAYVHRSSDAMFVNLEMLSEGYAHVLSIAPNTTYAAQFRAAEREARNAGRGLWSACPPAR